MKTTVGFIYKHLAHEYSVTATFTREDTPRLAMHSETGVEGEWQMEDIRVEDEYGECWYMEFAALYIRVVTSNPICIIFKPVAEIVLEKAYGEIE